MHARKISQLRMRKGGQLFEMVIDPDCISWLAFWSLFANIASDWNVYLCLVTPLVATSLSNGWFWLICFGTCVGFIVTLVQWYLFFTANPRDLKAHDLRTFASQWVFLSTLCEDVPLLILSFNILNNLPTDMCVRGDVDISVVVSIIAAFKFSCTASLAVSVFRLVKLYFLGCPTCGRVSQHCLGLVYVLVSFLSCVMFVFAWYLTCDIS